MPADPNPRVDVNGVPKRYEPQAHSYGGAWADMLETPDGDWVSWKDYEALAATAARRLDPRRDGSAPPPPAPVPGPAVPGADPSHPPGPHLGDPGVMDCRRSAA